MCEEDWETEEFHLPVEIHLFESRQLRQISNDETHFAAMVATLMGSSTWWNTVTIDQRAYKAIAESTLMGVPLLGVAVLTGKTLLVRAMLVHGLSVDTPGLHGITPLMLAAAANPDLFDIWKGTGDPTLANSLGRTAQNIANRYQPASRDSSLKAVIDSVLQLLRRFDQQTMHQTTSVRIPEAEAAHAALQRAVVPETAQTGDRGRRRKGQEIEEPPPKRPAVAPKGALLSGVKADPIAQAAVSMGGARTAMVMTRTAAIGAQQLGAVHARTSAMAAAPLLPEEPAVAAEAKAAEVTEVMEETAADGTLAPSDSDARDEAQGRSNGPASKVGTTAASAAGAKKMQIKVVSVGNKGRFGGVEKSAASRGNSNDSEDSSGSYHSTSSEEGKTQWPQKVQPKNLQQINRRWQEDISDGSLGSIRTGLIEQAAGGRAGRLPGQKGGDTSMAAKPKRKALERDSSSDSEGGESPIRPEATPINLRFRKESKPVAPPKDPKARGADAFIILARMNKK